MNILIAGGTGFIGQSLVSALIEQEHRVIVLGRDKARVLATFIGQACPLTWDELTLEVVKAQDIIINLTGANIGESRWTEARKNTLYESRIDATVRLAVLCAELGGGAPALLNASAIGVYGLQQTARYGLPEQLDEFNPTPCAHPPDFLSQIGCAWEAATRPASEAGVRVCLMRFGVVLGPNGGVFDKLQLPFKLCAGGPIGSGHQPFTWVSLVDVVRAILFLIAHPELSGPFNIVAPYAVTQKAFAKAMGKALKRPAIALMPGVVVKCLFGQMGDELLLRGQHVVPTRLTQAGFEFERQRIEEALSYCVSHSSQRG